MRPHQLYATRGVHGLIKKGFRRVLCVGPTGSGKRFQMVWWAKQTEDRGKRALIVANQRTLVQQMYEELDRFGVTYGVIMAGEEPNSEAPIQVASLQTLRRRHFFDEVGSPTWGQGLPPADILLIDEADEDLSSYKALIDFYPGAIVIGLTATPVGPTGASLESIYPAMFIGSRNRQLIPKYRVPTRLFAPSEPNMEGVKITHEEYQKGDMIERVRKCTVFADVFNAWQPWSDLPTVCYVPGVEFSRWFANEFTLRGYRAAHVDAKTPLHERASIKKAMEDGEIRVLVNVGVIRRGVDFPCLACGIDVQPTLQYRDWVQKTGRICRPYPGKQEAIWLDFSGAWWRHGHPDDDFPWELVTGAETVKTLKRQFRDKTCWKCGAIRKKGFICPSCGHTEQQPISCPKCSHVRKFGDTCPNCGFKSVKLIRRVRMGDGKIVEQGVLYGKGKKVKTPEQRAADNWKGALIRAGRANQTIAQALHHYREKIGEYPPWGLNYMPPKDHQDWKRKVTDVYGWVAKIVANSGSKKKAPKKG